MRFLKLFRFIRNGGKNNKRLNFLNKRVAAIFVAVMCLFCVIGIETYAMYYPNIAVLYANYTRTNGQSYAEKANIDYYYHTYDDSTNFVSQALFYGGVRMSYDSSYKDFGLSPEKSIWYHTSTRMSRGLFNYKLYSFYRWKYSSTWIYPYSTDSEAGNGFYQAMCGARHVDHYECKNVSEVFDVAFTGDVIIVKPDGKTYGQMLLVTDGKKPYSLVEQVVPAYHTRKKNKNDVLVSSHSSDMKDVSFRDDIDSYYRLKNPNVRYELICTSDFALDVYGLVF